MFCSLNKNRKRTQFILIVIKIKNYTLILSFFLVCFDRGITSTISEWFDGFRIFSIDVNYPTNWPSNDWSISIGTMVLAVNLHSTAAFDCKMKQKEKEKSDKNFKIKKTHLFECKL